MPTFSSAVCRARSCAPRRGITAYYDDNQCTPHTPGTIFHARFLHGWNRVGAQKASVGIISPRAFWRRIVRYSHPLGCRAIKLRKPPQGVCVCDIHSRTTTGMQRQQYALTCCSPKSTHYLYTTVYIISPPPWGGFPSSTAQQPKRGRQ